LYPLVIGYDDGFGKGASGLVMRYFRSLSHASTLDSLSSSFMCNVVNEANTIIPPPYSCNNSVDELSSVGAAAGAAALVRSHPLFKSGFAIGESLLLDSRIHEIEGITGQC
jgi:hypothetical protein